MQVGLATSWCCCNNTTARGEPSVSVSVRTQQHGTQPAKTKTATPEHPACAQDCAPFQIHHNQNELHARPRPPPPTRGRSVLHFTSRTLGPHAPLLRVRPSGRRMLATGRSLTCRPNTSSLLDAAASPAALAGNVHWYFPPAADAPAIVASGGCREGGASTLIARCTWRWLHRGPGGSGRRWPQRPWKGSSPLVGRRTLTALCSGCCCRCR